MPQKWNLQDIRPASAPRSVQKQVARKPSADISPRAPKAVTPREAFDDSDLSTIDVIDGKASKRKRVVTTVIIALCILGAAFFVNVMLGGAVVTVYPKMADVSVKAEFTASSKPQTGELGYELLVLEATGEKQVQASGKENVSLKAEGKIFIYNTKSTAPQRLIKNTRFETKEGLIFRIKESVEVPGASKDTKGNLVPGSIAADVVADAPGEAYNIAPTRFTVPGLKGGDQYDYVYGESTTAFAGGFEGEKYLIDDAELSTAQQALHMELRDKLLSELKAKRPAGFVIYEDAVAFAYTSLPATEYGDSLATIKEKAELQVPMFIEPEFAKFLAEKTISDYTGDPVTIVDPKTITFSYVSATTSRGSIKDTSELEFMLSGSARVVWTFDEKKLQKELIGRKKSDVINVFKSYTSIREAKSEIKPFWATTFPGDPGQIKVETIIEPAK